MMQPRYLFLFLLGALTLLVPRTADAQTGSLVGTVRDAAGVPLPGINVVLAGTTLGDATDLNGDIHASPEYRAHLVLVMAKRAVSAASD